MDEKSEACQKGGRTTQRIKSLEREVERLKDDLYKTIQLMEFWKYNWTEEYERMYFMPQSRKVE